MNKDLDCRIVTVHSESSHI